MPFISIRFPTRSSSANRDFNHTNNKKKKNNIKKEYSKDRNDQTIEQIPHEILLNHIFVYLEGLELFLKTRKVSFTWNELITKNDTSRNFHMKSCDFSETQKAFSERGISLVANLSRNSLRCESFYQCAKNGLFGNVSTLVLSGLHLGIVRSKKEMISLKFVPSFPGKTIVSRGYIKIQKAQIISEEATFNQDEYEGGSVLKFIPKLTHLNLSENNFGDERNNWVKDLSSQRILHLNLSGNDFGLATCEYISTSMVLTHLQYLNLNNNSITEACCKCLASADFKNLSVLKLVSNRVNNIGLFALCESSSITGVLEHLDVSSNEITDEACYELAKGRFPMKHLTIFRMRNNEGITSLTKKMLLQNRENISHKLTEENFIL
ncbi:hypothetical protein FDP41_008872 [Naegleria fowleri]|uniref:F-box domain-containing protein n=1 Tax=Naegleria fowleri TaxID=5763 RepID=A0A6A5AYT0_NAEFO|nr:uncharacterized protein FDP41_008872 [Naegleria fowleri]KAF0972623.1 hypothetical protein FDP41_008872 [Naegleria fowleri]CAG4718638.1 unnamed protein product [Naegleria fowleri]